MHSIETFTRGLPTLKKLLFRSSIRRSAAITVTSPLSPLGRQASLASTMAKGQISSSSYFDHIKTRHSYYPLSKNLTVSKAKIQEILRDVLLYVPSSFNMQEVRIVVLFGDEHDKLWDLTGDALRAKIGDERYNASTKGKMAMFKGAAGTVSHPHPWCGITGC